MCKFKRYRGIGTAAACLLAAGSCALAQSPADNNVAPNAQMESTILSQMHHVDQMEIQAGRLASQKGSARQVREYGQRLVIDHTVADQKVTNFGRAHNIPIMDMSSWSGSQAASAAANSDQQQMAMNQQQMAAMMQNLPNLQGAEFDKQFLDLMQHGHEMAVTMLQGAYSSLPAGSPLRSFVGKMLPVLEQHYTIASNLGLKVTAQMMR